MRFLAVLLLTSLIGCSTIGDEKVDKGLCLKFATFISERLECVGGRGISPEVCVVRKVPMTHCTVWEWPEGRPEGES